MRNWKYLALSTVMALGMSAGLAGCPEDEEGTGQCPDQGDACTSASDCETGACDSTCGVCFTSCTTDADCTGGQVCGPVCEGSTAMACQDASCVDAGTGGTGGGGGDEGECEDHGDCFAETAYCAEPEGEPSFCQTWECGTEFNDCNLCSTAPESGAREADGPVLFLPEQADLSPDDAALKCKKEARCGANDNVCEFRFPYQVADGASIPAEYFKVLLVHSTKSTACTTDDQCDIGAGFKCFDGVCLSGGYEAAPTVTADYVAIRGCYAPQNATPGGVVVVYDNMNRRSNAVCFQGDAP